MSNLLYQTHGHITWDPTPFLSCLMPVQKVVMVMVVVELGIVDGLHWTLFVSLEIQTFISSFHRFRFVWMSFQYLIVLVVKPEMKTEKLIALNLQDGNRITSVKILLLSIIKPWGMIGVHSVHRLQRLLHGVVGSSVRSDSWDFRRRRTPTGRVDSRLTTLTKY